MADGLSIESILNQSLDLIAVINRDFTFAFVNDSYCRQAGLERSQILGRPVSELQGSDPASARMNTVFHRAFAGDMVEYLDDYRVGAVAKYMHVSYSPYHHDDESEVTRIVVSARDVSRLSEMESRLTRYEFLDPTTGLFNRRSFNVILEKEIYRAHRSAIPAIHAILLVSLQNFAELHQTFGPEMADVLLENTGLRIRQTVRESDYVFRYEGNDLTVLLTNIARTEDAAVVAKKIHEEISVPYSHQGIDTKVEAIIGIAAYPEDGETSSSLISHANSAVIDARNRGLAYCMYNREVFEHAIARITLRSELQRAFEHRQFILNYQPFVDVHGMPHGAEALIRWNHPTRGLLMPGVFIGLAEETRLISSIDRWALFEVCRQLSEWSDLPDLFVSINISAKDLLDEYLVEVVALALKKAGNVHPGRLKLELTERISMDDPDVSIRTMEALIELGVDVWIDDFGTGQSSLSYLKHLPADVLKIDKVFIDEIADNDEDREYLESITRAIRSRGKRIVIEGVSNGDQLAQLQNIDCEYLQGYYFSRPVGPQELYRLVTAGERLPMERPT
ncbi:MAG: EAL domain-containing protein [Spirochaetales bacterium]|nr:MAG: EAL domain-containing protein [Spirochaetales bacterium]